MKQYMLDTDVASYLIRDSSPGLNRVFAKHFSRCCVSSITVAELKFGAAKRQSAALFAKVDAFCNLLPIREWTAETAECYGRMRAALESAGTPLASMDLLIAAAALDGGAVLVTNNTAHFSKVPGLKIENWLE